MTTTEALRWDTDEQKALRQLAADFTRKEILPHLDTWEREGSIPRELHRKAADAGLLGASVAEEHGGSGGNALDMLTILEQIILSGGSSGLISALFSHGIATPHIIASGNTDLIDRYARPALEGRMIGSLAITEPSGGSDVANIRTTARREGDEYVINGAKLYITSGTRADFVTTAVRTGDAGAGGISLIVVPTDTPGFTVSRKLDKMGWLCSDTAELFYDDVRVPVSNLIGAENSAFGQIAQQFQGERLSLAFQAVATAQRCFDLTVDWVKSRETMGRPLSKRQVVRHRLAELATEITAAQTFCRSVAERWANGEGMLLETSMAKNNAVKVCDTAVMEAVQLAGGIGLMRESEVERHFRDARVLGIGGGTTEIMNEIISKLLGL
ncbi:MULTISPECIES: acyl-CoA dehydrogenase family protein [unclassified Rhodococcus (in: high G+C Gram-positive bacteria)]|uniref:acyl-CoA dehydrogenase family protein n=1 Tax=unclassified Rhodococcus (in: high G+C Gram-positive bacteria) TaxID=192944 RepID=UPI00146BAF51|nr:MULTISPECIES: acyl-CoA dehydrogenase family protein [unclassified Rhodococcus (in: high G+C Gram-positive bacteria)]MBF0663024.1 acyl-CoA dehydrogenase family protein [Rhodococcus sp. (in: high G+C Gram-positive bacteria)]NMD96193.1 acyl-CoA dehydrogenase [Rhodococcus sp. BL-253-APC-6A1W]NME80068.1 acyl-CoA dehydrogenase [Rhodococcus sp. 105337]